MSKHNKGLMNHYADGSIVNRELENLLYNVAADARFARDHAEDLEVFMARQNVLIHKGNTGEKS